MSFFSEFLSYFKISDTTDRTLISMIANVGIMIVGKIKIKSLSEDKIEIKSNQDMLCISGQNLKIKSLAKGEVVVSGNINNIQLGE